MTIKRTLVITLLLAGMVLGSGHMAPAQDLDPDEVRGAIDGAIRYLKNTQKPNGSWEEVSGHPCGASSLCVLALLSAGLTKDDPAVNQAMSYLRKFSPEGSKTYTVALQTMAYAMADPQRDMLLIQKNVAWLEAAQIKGSGTPEYNGGWSYDISGGVPDNSNVQYAILGLYEAERAGAMVKPETWQAAKTYLENCQNRDGSWGYMEYNRPEGQLTMTSAGVANLIMINGILGGRSAFVRDGDIYCCQPDENPVEDRINRGLVWLTRRFTTWPGSWNYYYLYGIERVGRLSALRLIGVHDWFREGTQALLQKKGIVASYWKGEQGSETYDHIATAYALLFLAKGRRPILVSKGKYADDSGWSPHPNDLHHLTQFAERQWRLEMSWPIIDIRSATVDDLLQTPVLFLCGDKSLLSGTPQQRRQLADNLRGYIDRGGFIFAEANPEDDTFDAGFRQLMRDVFDNDPEYELRLLDVDHPVWSIEITIPVEQMRKLEGIDYGCRTSVVYVPPHRNLRTDSARPVPPSLSCLWELQRFHQRGEPYPEHVQEQIDAALGIGLNVLAYATGRSPRFKYEIPTTANQRLADHVNDRGNRIQVAMLDLQGNANSAPRAIPKLLDRLAREMKLPVDVRPIKITPDQDEIFDYPILFMHGRNAIELTDAQRDRLRRYIENGGFLFVNAICSSKPFTESFRREMATLFPNRKLTKLAPNDPLLTDACGGFNLPTLMLRTPQRIEGRRTEVVNVPIAPELEGVSFDGRWRVVLSPYDLSCALEEMSGSLQCQGYTQEDAFKLALNAILYAIEYF
ncbi:MAG: DUF4159 domain-containing protein [Planctomycetaceae bacterium]|nr:DUF4159 domain-containing protein [Planctomycetaceae bacterium]